MSGVISGGVIKVSRNDFVGYFKLSISLAEANSDVPKLAKNKKQVNDTKCAISSGLCKN